MIRYYKDAGDGLYAFECEAPEHLTEITKEEYDLANAPVINPNDLILAKIAELEASVTTRRMREALLGTDNGWMKALDEQIATLRNGLK